MRAKVLVVVNGGVADSYESGEVDVQIIDLDILKVSTHRRKDIPAGMGFEELVSKADVDDWVTFTKEEK